jgi:hypothetical protein
VGRDVKVQGTFTLRHNLRIMYGSSLELWVKSQCHRFEVFTVRIQVRMTCMTQAFGISTEFGVPILEEIIEAITG